MTARHLLIAAGGGASFDYVPTPPLVPNTPPVYIPPTPPPVVPPPTPPPSPDPPAPGTLPTFTGTGGDDTAAVKAFVESKAGQHIALAGTIKVTSTQWTISNNATTTIDFLSGAKFTTSSTSANATLILYGCRNLVINNLEAVGRGYGTYFWQYQWQHGVAIYGGSNITLNRPYCHDTFGDGIDVDVFTTAQATPLSIVVNNPRMARNCRNGITGNAGQLTVNGGTIDQSGLHNIDMEPNGDYEARSIDMTFKSIRLTNHDDMLVADDGGPSITGWAVGGLGYSSAQKKRIHIESCSADQFTLAIDRAAIGVFRNNSSDVAVSCQNAPGTCSDTAFVYGMSSLTVSGNTNIVVNTTYDIR